jgi:hypothetical protein
MKPFSVKQFELMMWAHKTIYEEQIEGYSKVAGKVGRKVALALLVATLKKVAAEKFHPKPGNSESPEQKIIREFKIERMVFGLLLSAKIIKMD